MVRPDDISTVVGLFRVSTETQEREGYSLQAQQQAFTRDCRAFKWRSLTTFEGYESGSSLSQRKIIHDLIALVRKRQPDAVWVIEQSRLTRGDELDVAMLLRELRELSTKVVTERGNVIDPADLEGAFVFRLKALMDRRGEGVSIILERCEKLAGIRPVFELPDESELKLTIFAASSETPETKAATT